MGAVADHPGREVGHRPEAAPRRGAALSSTVASIPLAGEAVTETVAPAGRNAAWAIDVPERDQLELGRGEDPGEGIPGRAVELGRAAEHGPGRPQTNASGIDALLARDELEERLVDGRDRSAGAW